VKQATQEKKKVGYVKPKLVVYGDFAEITKFNSVGTSADAAFNRDVPAFS